MSARNNRGIGPVPEGLDDGLQDFLMQVRRHITDVLAGKVTVASGGSSNSGGSVTVIGGGGGGGTPYEPDLTPPPAPTGVVITAGFANVLIETDAPTFTQGHGHLKTIVYGKKYGGTGPLPTFSSDSKQREFTGNIDTMPSDLGTEWHFWLSWVTKDGVEGAVAGGVNGYATTLGKIGHSDLGPLIVEADNLVDGTVTASKIAAGAVSLTKFANGIEPVTIVTGALPAAFITKTIFWTDGKLYRWNGAAYTKAVDGADIVAASITAGQIAAGAIGTDQLAANAVTTGKLLVTGRGAALNDDPGVQDATAWNNGAFSIVTIGDGVAGLTVMRATNGQHVFSRSVALDPAKQYRVRCRVRRTADAPGTFYLRAYQYDAAGTQLTFNIGVEGVAVGTGWQTLVGSFTPAAGTVRGHIGLVFNWNSGTGYMEAQDIRLEEYIGADLIVDGAIVASKISAGAIAVGSAAIADGAIRNALIENLAVDNAKIASMSVAKLLAGALSVGQYVRSSNFVTGVSGWNIAADGSAEFGAASIRGQLTATQINANGLIVRDNAGNPLLGVGFPVPLAYSDPGTINSNLPSGQNLVANSDQTSAMTMAATAQRGDVVVDVGLQWALNIWATTYSLRGGLTKNLTLHQNNVSGGGDGAAAVDIYPLGPWDLAHSVACRAGQRLCFSAYMNAHRCSVGVGVEFFDAAGAMISDFNTGPVATLEGSCETLDQYVRPSIIATAPAGTAYVRPFARKFNTRAGQAESWVWLAAPMLEPVGSTATGPSDYQPGVPSDTRQLGYGGDLNATYGATIGANLGGSFTQASWDVVMTSTYIRASHIQQLTANNLTVDALSRTMNGQVSGTPSGQRLEMVSNGIQGFDVTNALRWEIGIF